MIPDLHKSGLYDLAIKCFIVGALIISALVGYAKIFCVFFIKEILDCD